MSKSVKFTFDTHFDADAPTAGATAARSRKSYSADEIEALKHGAREEGRNDGGVRASLAVAASIGQVAAAVLGAIRAMDGEIEAIRGEAAALALAAAKKLAGAALSAAPEAEILEALHIALRQAVGEPRVVVRTTPELAQTIEARAAQIAAQEGFEGRMQFVADSAFAGADCRIEWQGGGIERAQTAIEQALEELIVRRFARQPAERTS